MSNPTPWFDPECVFCKIVESGHDHEGITPAWFERSLFGVAFEPRDPLVVGHRLFVPTHHVPSADIDPTATVAATKMAFRYMRDLADQGVDSNLLINSGPAAGQTVFHLHVHVLPRRVGADGVVMPWDHTQGCPCQCTGTPPRTRPTAEGTSRASDSSGPRTGHGTT